jgi:hypothetical protein
MTNPNGIPDEVLEAIQGQEAGFQMGTPIIGTTSNDGSVPLDSNVATPNSNIGNDITPNDIVKEEA